MQLRRQHDIQTNGNIEQSEDNSKDGSEGGNSSVSNTSFIEKPSSNGSGDDSRPAQSMPMISFGDLPTLESSESKPSKSIKVKLIMPIVVYYICWCESNKISKLIIPFQCSKNQKNHHLCWSYNCKIKMLFPECRRTST